MLQWMGGSRRKVTASRKSTHNRQKQYFEQRKRQQQTPGQAAQENNTDVRNKRTHYHEEPRSLDILSLVNLVSVAQQCHSSQENGSELGTISPNKSSSPFVLRNIPPARRSGGKLDGRKILMSPSGIASNNTDAKLNQKEDAETGVSVLELLSDDEPKSNSEGRSVPEAHVAFSVEGLGKVGIETPAHSPRIHRRGFPSIPKALKRTQPSVQCKSIPNDLLLEPKVMMHDIEMSHDRKPSESICNLSGIFDDLVNTRNKKFMFSRMSPDAYENLAQNCNDEKELFHAYKDGRKEPKRNTRFSILDGNFLDEAKYDIEGHPSFPSKVKTFETYDNRFGDPFSESSRYVFEACQRSEISASPPYFKDLRSEKDYNCVSFDWERSPAGNESYDFDSIFNPPAWSFAVTEDSQDSMSLLSEESCSSAAVREEKNYGFGPRSGKLKYSKIDHRKRRHVSSEKKYTVEKFPAGETMYTGLDEAPQKNIRNAGYHSKYSSALHGTWDSECISLPKEGCTSAEVASGPSSYRRTSMEIDTGLFGSLPKEGCTSADFDSGPSFYRRTSMEIDTGFFGSLPKEGFTSAEVASGPSSYRRTSMKIDSGFFGPKFMPDANLFDVFPVPQVCTATDFKNRKSKSKIPDDHDSPIRFIYENDMIRELSDPGVKLQKPATHPLGTESHFPYAYCAGDLKEDTQFPHLSRQQKARKGNEDGYGTVYKPQNEDTTQKKSSSSVNGGSTTIPDCKSNCSDHEESKGENQELFDGPPCKAEEAPMATEGVPTQPASCIDEKLDHRNGTSPVPSEIVNEDSMKEKLKPGRSSGTKGGGNSDASYQVMLESYVLQLLCVQKVLMEASGKDIKKV